MSDSRVEETEKKLEELNNRENNVNLRLKFTLNSLV
jgi:hypothetical protein